MLALLTTAYTAVKSKFWQYLGVAAVVVGVLLGAVRVGQRLNRTDQLEDTLEQVQKKVQVDDEVARLSPDARRDALREWMPDN